MSVRAPGVSRLLSTAVVTSTVPLIALGSTAVAAPAPAGAASTALQPRVATPSAVQAAQAKLSAHLVPSDRLASALPLSLAPATSVATARSGSATKTYTVKSGDTLSHIAAKNDISLSRLLSLNDLKSTTTIFPGQKIKLSGSSSASSAKKTSSGSSSSSSSSSSSAKSYTVKSGDTLSAIAVRNNVSLSTLLKANGLKSTSVIYPGQKLKLSGSASSSSSSAKKTSSGSSSTSSSSSSSTKSYTVKSGDTLSAIAVRNNVSLSTLLKANGLKSTSVIYPGQKLKLSGSASSTSSSSSSSSSSGSSSSSSSSSASSSKSYTVKRGDTLSAIAVRNNVSLSTLLKANGLKSTSVIYPGQSLKLSGSASSTSTSSSSSSSSGSSSSSSSSSSSKTYTVKSGDTLSGIAARNGISLSSLLSANGFSSSTLIYPGQSVKLSGSGSSTSSSSSSSSSSGSSISTASSGSSSGEQLVPNTFLHYTYPDHVVSDANRNKQQLLNSPLPSRSEAQALVRSTAASMGVDPSLALAHAFTESHFDAAAVSPANAIGIMQVIPSSGEWASQMVGRELNLLDPQDNVVAGVAIIRHLQRTADSLDLGIAAYYQGAAGVKRNGMYPDTKDYVNKVKGYMGRF